MYDAKLKVVSLQLGLIVWFGLVRTQIVLILYISSILFNFARNVFLALKKSCRIKSNSHPKPLKLTLNQLGSRCHAQILFPLQWTYQLQEW